jgi:hypothetical protein
VCVFFRRARATALARARGTGFGRNEEKSKNTCRSDALFFFFTRRSHNTTYPNTQQELEAEGVALLVDEGEDTPWDLLLPSRVVRFWFCFLFLGEGRFW